MAFNDIAEENAYELAKMRDVTRITQGSSYFTVVDLSEGFYLIERLRKEISIRPHLNLMEEYTNGTMW